MRSEWPLHLVLEFPACFFFRAAARGAASRAKIAASPPRLHLFIMQARCHTPGDDGGRRHGQAPQLPTGATLGRRRCVGWPRGPRRCPRGARCARFNASADDGTTRTGMAGVMRALPVSLLVSGAAYMTGLVSPPIAAVMFVLMMVPAHMPTASITPSITLLPLPERIACSYRAGT